jgi:hypothetical protein
LAANVSRFNSIPKGKTWPLPISRDKIVGKLISFGRRIVPYACGRGILVRKLNVVFPGGIFKRILIKGFLFMNDLDTNSHDGFIPKLVSEWFSIEDDLMPLLPLVQTEQIDT